MDIAALCVNNYSVYKRLGLNCYDKNRDVRTFLGTEPVICHPPCRGWSAYMRHQAKPPAGEKDLALFCAERVLVNGGILEHPAHSRFMVDFLKIKAGQEKGPFRCIEIHQSWFGYPMRKRTWLLMPATWSDIDIPFRLTQYGKEKQIFENMSQSARSMTTEQFAKWLIALIEHNVTP